MKNQYDTDIVEWASQQAKLLRTGNFSAIDADLIAEEIEDMGKREKRELFNRMAILLAHLLKWKYQPARRGASWERTIKVQRVDTVDCISDMPSLKKLILDPDWKKNVWERATVEAYKETGIEVSVFPDNCPWENEQILSSEFFPD
jgi:hypothetical protein